MRQMRNRFWWFVLVPILAFGLLQGSFSHASEPGDGRTVTVILPGNVPLELVPIRAGKFSMGSPKSERGRWKDESPRHEVTLTRGFDLGRYPVTQRQWLAVTGANPSRFQACGLECPVESVSWEDACGGATGSSRASSSFLGKLNAHLAATGQAGAGSFRLPTEAEWEYAARAGTATEFSFVAPKGWDTECETWPEADAHMWWCGNAGGTTHPVGRKKPNPWGLHDAHGNVWEFVADWFGAYPSSAATDPEGPPAGTQRVARGGCWYYFAHYARSAYRIAVPPDGRNAYFGFRVARSR
jgi:formylglycine-generating enzyme required for sulfatase activity